MSGRCLRRDCVHLGLDDRRERGVLRECTTPAQARGARRTLFGIPNAGAGPEGATRILRETSCARARAHGGRACASHQDRHQEALDEVARMGGPPRVRRGRLSPNDLLGVATQWPLSD
eukprot:scaffold182362_cov26-Tisochrysis_lutea.AAC.2